MWLSLLWHSNRSFYLLGVMIIHSCVSPIAVDNEKKDMEHEVEKLKVKVEHEMQPNIAFEEETQALQSKVLHAYSLMML